MSDEVLPYSELALSVKPGRYRHFKGGEYEVIGVSRHSEDPAQEFVVYKSFKTGYLWIRPLEMFLEQVEHNGYKVSRFTYVSS